MTHTKLLVPAEQKSVKGDLVMPQAGERPERERER